MNRRGFLRMLGTGAAVGAVAAVAPSQVWPFRKIFLPALNLDEWGLPAWVIGSDNLLASLMGASKSAYPGRLCVPNIQAIELENFAKEIPALLKRESAMYEMYKSNEVRMARAARANYLGVANWILCDDHGNDYETTVQFATRKGYLTNPSPIIGQMPLGPPNVQARILSWEPNEDQAAAWAAKLKEKPVSAVVRAARKFVDSLKVRNEDLGFEDWDG